MAEEAPTGQRLPRSVLRSLLAFSQASELKKLAFEAAAASAPQESLETLNRIWAGLDDGSGSLSYERWQAHVAAHHEVGDGDDGAQAREAAHEPALRRVRGARS